MPPNPLKRKRDPELEPCISELLRTCIHPNSLLLRVEQIVREEVAVNPGTSRPAEQDEGAETRYVTRLFLTDRELTIQALLSRALIERQVKEEIGKGDLVDVEKFKVKKAKRLNGLGYVVYLSVESCEVVESVRGKGTTALDVEGIGRALAGDKSAIGHCWLDDGPDQGEGQVNGLAGVEVYESEDSSIAKPVTASTERDRGQSYEGIHLLDSGNESITVAPPSAQVLQIEPEQDHNHITPHGDMSPTAASLASKSPSNRDSADTPSPTKMDVPVMAENAFTIHQHSSSNTRRSPSKGKKGESELQSSQGSDSDDFETIPVHTSTVLSRRQALHELQHSISRNSASLSTNHDSEISTHPHHDSSTSPHPQTHHTPLALAPPTNLTTLPPSAPQPPLLIPPPTLLPISTITALSSLLSATSPFPGSKSSTLSLLVITTWISPSLIHRPGPFPPKRHLKVHDLSITRRYAGVTLAVFVDAARFRPALGTVALVRGVGVTRLPHHRGKGDGEVEVILNAYPSLKEKQEVTGEKWWVDGEGELERMGFGGDVERLKVWWAERQRTGNGNRG